MSIVHTTRRKYLKPKIKGGPMKLYSPWVLFHKQIEKLFEKDPEVSVSFDTENMTIKLFVDNEAKADALSKLLPLKKEFGNVEVKIEVVPADGSEYKAKYFRDAFEGNEAFSHLTTISDIPDVYISNPISYCVFKKEVVQYGADDLSSETGMRSTLYEDLAREIFGSVEGVYFCTDAE